MPADIPLLSLLLLIPLVGAAILWILPSWCKLGIRGVALLSSLLTLGASLLVLVQFDPAQAGFQLTENHAWIPSLNVHYSLGVDGISVLFLPLTSLLFSALILASWTMVRTLPTLYFSLLLFLLGVTLGIFMATDSILFFLFWELTLIPIYFLISLWGVGPNRRYAAVKYTLFMLVGGILILFGFVLLAFNYSEHNGVLSFDYLQLLNTPMAHATELSVFLLLLAGFGMKTPVFPFHTWLPTVSMEGPASIAAMMTGLKLGAYGLIRFAVPMAPGAAQELHWLLAALGVIGILYGALIAISQTNLRAMLAYSSISHIGLVVLGIASLNIQGIQGAVFQLLNFSIIASGLFLLTGFLHHRTGSTDIASLGGAARSMPLLTALFLLFGLASMGVPGTSGFPAEFLIIVSTLKTHTGAGLAALAGVVIGAGYFLSIYRRTFLGPITRKTVREAVDLRRRELLIMLVMAAMVLFAGFYPASVLDLTREASGVWVSGLQQ